MIYPSNYEQKIGFDEIRRMLKGHCQSTLGQEKVDEMAFSDDASVVNECLEQVREMRRLMQAQEKPEMNYFFDVRESVARIRLENTHLEEDEVWDLRRSLETIANIVRYLNRSADDDDAEREGFALDPKGRLPEQEPEYPYPALHRLTEGVMTFPAIVEATASPVAGIAAFALSYACFTACAVAACPALLLSTPSYSFKSLPSATKSLRRMGCL